MDKRLWLEKPGKRWQETFIEAVQRSRSAHRGWVQPPADAAAYTRWLGKFRRAANAGFLLCHEADGLVGVINIFEITRGGLQSAYLGYYLFTPFTGRGYMTDGLRQAVSLAFRELRLHRVEAGIQPANTASIAVVRRLGFRYEGCAERLVKVGGRWRDHERWAMLREHWRPRAREK